MRVRKTSRRSKRRPFSANIHFGPSCWEWIGSKTPCGYGKYNDPVTFGRPMAHRVAYETWSGEPIPPGMQVCHRCDNPSCVRPDHLFLGTPRDNMQDMVAKGRNRSARQTHCKHGHEFTPENTYRDPGIGARHCRTCMTMRKRRGTNTATGGSL